MNKFVRENYWVRCEFVCNGKLGDYLITAIMFQEIALIYNLAAMS
jgi:hypothetical protein